jgi:O-antigen ligase
MKKTLFVIANLIAFSCAMRSWQFNFPPRVFIFDLLSMVFVFGMLLYCFLGWKTVLLRKELKYFILFQWLYLFITGISGLNIIALSAGQESFSQYYKSILSGSFHTLFFTLFVLYLSNVRSSTKNTVLKFYIAGVICSCVYGMVYLTMWKFYNINIGSYIWNQISYGTEHAFDVAPSWAVMGIPRGIGFPGVGAAATYVVTILPLLLLSVSFRRKSKDIMLVIIAVLGLLVTMSRTGLLSFGVAVLLLIILERRRLFSFIKPAFVISVPLGCLAYVWWGYVSEILKYRTHIDFSRFALFRGAIELFAQNPVLGVGANNYSVARFSLPNEYFHDANIHNSWLTILVELGLVGLLFKTAFFAYIIYAASLRRNILSRAFICTIVGLSAGALFNQVFDLFYFNFYVALVFAIIVSEDVPLRPARRLATSIRFK